MFISPIYVWFLKVLAYHIIFWTIYHFTCAISRIVVCCSFNHKPKVSSFWNLLLAGVLNV